MYQIWYQSVQPFGRLSRCLNFWPTKTPQMPPWGLEELIVFSLCPFPDESAHVCQILCQLVHPFGRYSRFLNFRSHKPQPCWVTRVWFLFSPLPFGDESACVCQIWSQSDHRRRRVYARKDTHTHTHTLSYIDIDMQMVVGSVVVEINKS